MTSDDTDAGGATGRGTALVLALAGLCVAPTPVLISFAPSLTEWMGRTPASTSCLFTIALAGGCVGALFGGAWIARREPIAVLRVTMPLAALVAALVAIAPSALAFLLALPVMTAALSCTCLGATALLSRLNPRSPRRVMSLQLVVLAGLGILVPLAAGLAAHRLDALASRRAFGLGIGLIAVCIAALAPAVGRIRIGALAARAAPAPRGHSSELCAIGLLAALHAGGDTAMYHWAPTLLAGLGRPPVPPAWVLSGFALSYLIGRSLLVLMPERLWERRLVLMPGAVAALLLVLVLAGSTGFAASFVLLVCASFCYGLEYPALLGVLARRDPSAFPLRISACAVGGAIGALVVTSQVGYAAKTSGVATALLIVPATFAAFSGIAWALTRGERRESARELSIV